VSIRRDDLVLINEAYDEVLANEKFNWKGALGAAVMATSPIVTSCSRTSDSQISQDYPQVTQTTNQLASPDQCSLLFKDKESIAYTILYKDVIVKVKKSDYLKAIYGEEGANKYLSAMPQNVRDGTVYVYSIEASKKAGVKVSAEAGAHYNIKTHSIHFNGDYFTKTSPKLKELIQSLTHEISHGSNKNRFGKKFLSAKAAKESLWAPYGKSANYHLQLTEIRARIAATREYLGAVESKQEFMQKWNHVMRLLQQYSGDKKEFYSNNPEIPSQFKDLVYVYAKVLPKQHKNSQQEFLNYIIKCALDHSVAMNDKSDSKNNYA